MAQEPVEPLLRTPLLSWRRVALCGFEATCLQEGPYGLRCAQCRNLNGRARVPPLHTYSLARKQSQDERMIGGNIPDIIQTVACFGDFSVYEVAFPIGR